MVSAKSPLRGRLRIALVPASSLMFACVLPSIVTASVHVTYDIRQEYETDGFSASWLHAATGTLNGSAANGALLAGATTSRIAGNLAGELSGNVLSNVSGSVTGKLKQLSSFLNAAEGTSFTTSTLFELKLGGLSQGGAGALQFETNGAGSGEFSGGFLDFSLWIAGQSTSFVNGTFFFKPQAESGSAVLSPNRGTHREFTLWGWNWMHDGKPIDGRSEPEWNAFLSSLGFTGDRIDRTTATGAPGISLPLGISLHVVDPDPPSLAGLSNPEPTTLLIWGALVGLAAGVRRR